MELKEKNYRFFLFIIFLVALIVRYWWFPHNVYFGYDQARDAFVSQAIYTKGDLKLIGPSAGKEGLFHGPAYWYLIGPVYLFFAGNPAAVLAFISLLNALGVFLVYNLARELFDKKIGLLAAFIYSFSFSQSQYALYFANPSPAVLSIIIFYLGLALLIFGKKPWAWILIGLGLGFSVQFEFFLVYLVVSLLLIMILFRKEIKKNLNFRFLFWGLLSLGFSLSSFFLSELKYGFKTTRTLLGVLLPGKDSAGMVKLATSTFWERLGTEFLYNLFGFFPQIRELLAVVILGVTVIFIFKQKNRRGKFLFLLIWVISNFFLDFFGSPQLYYVGIGLSIAVIIIAAAAIDWFFKINKYLAFFILFLIFTSNLRLIGKFNPHGPLKDLYVQEGMFLENEKKIVDTIYSDINGGKFTVNALTMPYKIKTTWAYLFNWYGQQRYGYLPFWGGEDVPGYEGKLPLPESDKYIRYAIMEPSRGIPEELKKTFLDSENGYATPSWQLNIGQFELQKREP